LSWKVKVFAPLLNDQQITHGNIRNDTESVNRVSTLTRCDAIATANYRLAGMPTMARSTFEEGKETADGVKTTRQLLCVCA
jgi:hypothetical protein